MVNRSVQFKVYKSFFSYLIETKMNVTSTFFQSQRVFLTSMCRFQQKLRVSCAEIHTAARAARKAIMSSGRGAVKLCATFVTG